MIKTFNPHFYTDKYTCMNINFQTKKKIFINHKLLEMYDVVK